LEESGEQQTELEFGVPELRQLGMYILFGNLELERVLNAAGSHPFFHKLKVCDGICSAHHILVPYLTNAESFA